MPGFGVIVIIAKLLGKYRTIGYLDPAGYDRTSTLRTVLESETL